jgi:hypothetical protein
MASNHTEACTAMRPGCDDEGACDCGYLDRVMREGYQRDYSTPPPAERCPTCGLIDCAWKYDPRSHGAPKSAEPAAPVFMCADIDCTPESPPAKAPQSELSPIETNNDELISLKETNTAKAEVREIGKYIIKGHEVLFDLEMKPLLDRYSWSVHERDHTNYCETFFSISGKQVTVTMHRLLTGMRKLVVDHINGNGLDNRLDNLRLCTVAENNRNNKNSRIKTRKSLYKGVYFRLSEERWTASIGVDGKTVHLGMFETEIEAAKAYDVASEKYHGKYGRRNFPA